MQTRKIEEEKPIWLKRSKEEIKSLVLKLAEQGLASDKIGLILRDTYGIPSAKLIAGKITGILARHNIKHQNSDMVHLKKKLEKIKTHFTKNKQDKVAKRGLQITQSKIIKLEGYCKKKKNNL